MEAWIGIEQARGHFEVYTLVSLFEEELMHLDDVESALDLGAVDLVHAQFDH